MNKKLIVVDFQQDFIDGVLGTPYAKAIIPAVIDKISCRQDQGYEIIFTQDIHDDDYLETQEGRHVIEHCIRADGFKIHKEVVDEFGVNDDNYRIYRKDTFGSLRLCSRLRSQHEDDPIDEIELCGLVSSMCVITNALLLKTFLPEVQLTVDARCTAGITEKDYKASLIVMDTCHVNILNYDFDV